MGSAETVHERVRLRQGELTPSERRVGRTLLAGYPSVGLETVGRLAERAGVSGPTVLRFAKRLGYDGFAALQDALRLELDDRQATPLSLHAAQRDEGHGLLASAGDVLLRATAATLSGLPSGEVDAAVALLADPSRRVTAMGGRFSRVLAHYLVLHLMQVRTDSSLLPDSHVERVDALSRLTRRDVLVLFDYRRYEPATMRIASRAADSGARLVLVTDRWLSPVATVADVVLPCQVDAPSAYDSFVPSMAVVELLIAGVLAAVGEEGARRLQQVEAVGQSLDLL